jgi:hypothetical protein
LFCCYHFVFTQKCLSYYPSMFHCVSAAKPDPIFGFEPQGQKMGSVGLGWPSGSKFVLDWVGLRFFHKDVLLSWAGLNPPNRNIFFCAYLKVASNRLVYYSILNCFGQRSQYISIKFPPQKQSENPEMCY